MVDNNRVIALSLILIVVSYFAGAGTLAAQTSGPTLSHPIVFVTQVPIPADFTTIGSTFGNHLANVQSVGRGGDLWIRYADGTLRNLTAAAGFGQSGFQGASSIAVRDPAPHWSGQRVLFSMVVGATTQQYQYTTQHWQIYEITNLGTTETPVITAIANQPTNYNNISPIYTSDDRIIFTTDRPRNGAAHLYPQLDEYEEAPTVSGVWLLDPADGKLSMLTHSPSGAFTPLVDSFGRIIFTQWDHLQRDQQADADAMSGSAVYGTFDWSSEASASTILPTRSEVFPEPRSSRTDLLAGTNLRGHSFNHFFPWMMNQDGTVQETLNHIGRHELHSYFDKTENGDVDQVEFISSISGRTNLQSIHNFFQITEDPSQPGRYVGIDAPEFQSHAAGQIVGMSLPPGQNPDTIQVEWLTHRDTHAVTSSPSSDHSGLYRDPLILADGTLIAVHTAETRSDQNQGSTAAPLSRYDFRLKTLAIGTNGYWQPSTPLTSGLTKTISYWSPDVLVTYSGPLWELSPVSLRPRPTPILTSEAPALETPESIAFSQAGVNPSDFRNFLTNNSLAIVVSRNVTTRDSNDKQQPINLRISGTTTQTIGGVGPLRDIQSLQFFQADQLRGLGGAANPNAGRRVLARPMHDQGQWNETGNTGNQGSVTLAPDGSMAAFVPARRALSWQLTDNADQAVVRERYWLNFQPGEIRVCSSCHGLNTDDQAGMMVPTNTPQALVTLLNNWKQQNGASVDPIVGRGAVGEGMGGPYDVLLIDGNAGGAPRRVDVQIGQPFTLSMENSPTTNLPSPFVIWGLIGEPSAMTTYQSAIGAFAFKPHLLAPHQLGLFTLANSYAFDPLALYAAPLAPWTLSAINGLPMPGTYTLQAVIDDRVNPAKPFIITNAIILNII